MLEESYSCRSLIRPAVKHSTSTGKERLIVYRKDKRRSMVSVGLLKEKVFGPQIPSLFKETLSCGRKAFP